jgi:SAM-dependent methyltransferase
MAVTRELSSKELSDLYDSWHTRGKWFDPNPTPTALWHVIARRHMPPVEGRRVLEIGCGPGSFANVLVEMGADLIGADFSPAAVERARQRIGPNSRFEGVVADIQNMPFEDGSFDVTVSLMTLEHIPDPKRGLAELVRVTRPGGRLVVGTPNHLSLVGLRRLAVTRLLGRTWHEMDQPINQPLILPRVVWWLKRAGCKIDTVDAEGHYLWVKKWAFELDRYARPKVLMKWLGHESVVIATRK